jgi:hypothetical protein
VHAIAIALDDVGSLRALRDDDGNPEGCMQRLCQTRRSGRLKPGE